MKLSLLIICISFYALKISAQNIGIGTVSPIAALHIKGTGTGNQIILEESAGSMVRMSNDASSTGAYVGTTTNNSFSLMTNNAVRLTVANNGNIGIGQTNPPLPLSFTNVLGNKISFWSNGANYYGIGLQASTMQLVVADNASDISFGYGNSFGFTENMRLKGSGKLGIGTNVPEQQLSVAAGVVIDQENNNTGTSANMLSFGGSSGEGIGSKRTAGTNQYGLDFYTNNTQRMTIANNGNVGIGTNSPAASLQINGGLVLEPTSTSTTQANITLTVGNSSYIKLNAFTNAAAHTVTLTNGLSAGQILVIECTSIAPGGFNIQDGDNIKLTSTGITMFTDDTLTLIWNGSKWLEINRSDN